MHKKGECAPAVRRSSEDEGPRGSGSGRERAAAVRGAWFSPGRVHDTLAGRGRSKREVDEWLVAIFARARPPTDDEGGR